MPFDTVNYYEQFTLKHSDQGSKQLIVATGLDMQEYGYR